MNLRVLLRVATIALGAAQQPACKNDQPEAVHGSALLQTRRVAMSVGEDEEVWKLSGPGKCAKRGRKKVKSQMECQNIAVAKGLTSYSLRVRGKKMFCQASEKCNTPISSSSWNIYSADAEAPTAEEAAEAAAEAEAAATAAAAERERIRQLTASWPTSAWPQCGYDQHMCHSHKEPARDLMDCQNRARGKGHSYFQYTPYKHFGLCGTSATCDRPVPWPHKTGGEPSDWKIYTWGECVEWTTRSTTTTTTVTQAQNPVDTSMGTQKAVGGCEDPGERPDSAGDAWRAGSALGYALEVRLFTVPGVPHNPSKHSNYGPGTYKNNYGTPKQYYPVSRTDGKEGVVWIDATSGAVYMTWFAEDLKGSESVLLYTPETGETLQAATSNSQDGIVLITAKNAPGDKRSQEGIVHAVRFDSASGAQVKKVTVPNLGFWRAFSAAGSAAWDNETNSIALYFSRQEPMHADGINHQAGHVWILDGSSLTTKQKFWGASHSFDNSVMRAGDGSSFLVMDLGDAHPRSVQVKRLYRHLSAFTFTSDGVWSYKGTSKNVFPIKGAQGENKVYTELGHPGLTEVDDGLLALFVGEDSPKEGHWINAPRDVGFVKVSSDLQTIMSPNDGSHTGLNYITDHSSKGESASRLKTFKLSSGRVLISYEIWTPSKYDRTELMELDKDGNVVRGKWDTCEHMRLPPADDTFVRNGKGIAYAGSDEGLIRYEICAGAECY
mmetsp:Transcript_95922/g.213440  ORF Transcript_95922/g.213440 Transcript_95922/m.213440 type:complete len:722 (-) Transcript_95922:18-2183(-)